MPLSYIEWNDLLIKQYFNEDMAGKEVIIFADVDTINDIAKPHGESYDNFKNSIIEGPDWAQTGNICISAYQAFKDWRTQKFSYPPYFAYLVFFVTVATIGGDFSDTAYYPRLRRVLGEPETTGTYPSFIKIDDLWDDLEKWSTSDLNEAFGRFTKRLRGKWSHVGLLLSQVILSDKERRKLPQFFLEYGLDPADPPTIDVIIKQLAAWSRRELSHRTGQLLTSNNDSLIDLRQALAELVLSDLNEWDGVCEITPESATPSITPIQSPREAIVGLRVCLEIDEFAGIARASLRIKSNNPFPDDGLSFEYGGKSLTCSGSGVQGWSSKLVIDSNEAVQIFNPMELDWTKSCKFNDLEESWACRFRGCNVRVFLPGSIESLPDWIESQRVLPHSSYYICCRTELSEKIIEWGKSSNRRFDKVQMTGFKQGWELFSAEDIKASCPGIDILTLPGKSILHIRGGIKIRRTNKYLNFAPPHIIVDEGTDAVILTINGMPVKSTVSNGNVYSLPKDAPMDAPIIIELHKDYGTKNSSVTQRRIIYITSIDVPVTTELTFVRDKFGNIIDARDNIATDGGESTIKCVKGMIPIGGNNDDIRLEYSAPTYLSDRIIFIGGVIGQIADWPRENIPSKWKPVWALAKVRRDKWQVYFCGDPDQLHSPLMDSDSLDSRDIKHWKNTVYGMRRQIAQPVFKKYQILWREYQEVASND